MSIQIGVIGTGFGARVVAPVFEETDGCTVVAVVSARDDSGVAALCDDNDVDLVCVHSPPFLHAAHVRRAVTTGHAVLCDKPFGLDAGQAQTLLAAADAADCLHLLNFEFRYDPMRILVRDLITDGVIGRPEHVSWTHVSAVSRAPLRPHGWLFERAAGAGGSVRGAPTPSTSSGGCSAMSNACPVSPEPRSRNDPTWQAARPGCATRKTGSAPRWDSRAG